MNNANRCAAGTVPAWHHGEMDSAHDENGDIELGKAIMKGALIGLPTALVLLTLVIWWLTPNDIPDSIATALLPGILLGVFGGGFTGMAARG